MHTQYGAVLEEILLDDFSTDGPDTSLQPNIQALHQIVLDTLSDVQRRNEAMLFHHLPPRVLGTLSSALSDIKVSRPKRSRSPSSQSPPQLLNSISGKTDMPSVALFDDTSDISDTFTRKLDFLLTWSVTPLQYGDHRPYAAACLLQLWRDKAEERGCSVILCYAGARLRRQVSEHRIELPVELGGFLELLHGPDDKVAEEMVSRPGYERGACK